MSGKGSWRLTIVETAAQVAEPVVVLDRRVRVHDVIAVTDGVIDHARDLLGRVLEVVVHDHRVVPAGMPEARHHRIVLAEVAAELHVGHRSRVARAQAAADGVARVETSVVDEDDLEGMPTHGFHQPLDERSNGARAIVDGNHDRDQHAHPVTGGTRPAPGRRS